ncbi:MAG TPA: hypothetical protein VGN54_12875 [Mycobacteriales bacterium]|nr:hypothetical protein [Mycobacteriales bacterium]
MLLRPASTHRPPEGVDPLAWADALAEDTYELVSALAGLEAALVCPASERGRAEALVWPGTPIFQLPADRSAESGRASATQGLDLLLGAGADVAVVISDDVPDLPGLLLGKVFSALAGCPVAASPSTQPLHLDGRPAGGLVALGARAPRAGWLPDLSLDDALAVEVLHRAAPVRELTMTPGWARLRSTAELRLLDDNLAGWPATRALLGRG